MHIWSIDGTLTDAITLGQSESGVMAMRWSFTVSKAPEQELYHQFFC